MKDDVKAVRKAPRVSSGARNHEAHTIDVGFKRADANGYVLWIATAKAVRSEVPGHVRIRIKFLDGSEGNRFPRSGELIYGED